MCHICGRDPRGSGSTSVAIFIDTSGSPRERAAGDTRPKFVVAREALEAMLEATDAFVARRQDFPHQARPLMIRRFQTAPRFDDKAEHTVIDEQVQKVA